MAHARTAIRTALISSVTGLATTGTRVWVMRDHPWADADLPALNVRFEGEDVREDEGAMGNIDSRDLNVSIVGAQQGTSATTMAALDLITQEVEIAVAADSTLAGLVVDVRYLGCEFSIDDSGDVPTGTVAMVYRVNYRVSSVNP